MYIRTTITLLLFLATGAPSLSRADEALIAVASNFAEVMERLEIEFERQGRHSLNYTIGSTGALYAQINNGAPFDVFLAADQRRPALLEDDDLVVKDSRGTYAIGRLTLWSPRHRGVAANGVDTLRDPVLSKIAMANPRVAPYGLAARQTLTALGLLETLESKIVTGENVGQTYLMVATNNVDVGFVALSYVLSPRNRTLGSRWDVPSDLYTPIRQDAVMLKRAKSNEAAQLFMLYLRGTTAKTIIRSYGYDVE